MKKIINHLRNQPEEARRHILHVITFGFGIILIILWVYSLGTTITSKETKNTDQARFKTVYNVKR